MPEIRTPLPGVFAYLDKEVEAIAERLGELNGFCAYSAETLDWTSMRPESRVDFMNRHVQIQRSLRSLRGADV